MKRPTKPLWRYGMLDDLNLYGIVTALEGIYETGDYYSYDDDPDPEKQGYYQDYIELFDEMSRAAYDMSERINGYNGCYDVEEETFNDVLVALLGNSRIVLGFNDAEEDFFKMDGFSQDLAQNAAKKRLMRMTKVEIIQTFSKVIRTVLDFYDLKTGFDCLMAVVEELDERSALLSRKNIVIDRLYNDLTGLDEKQFESQAVEEALNNLPQRMWVE